jgi:hypothetical protein
MDKKDIKFKNSMVVIASNINTGSSTGLITLLYNNSSTLPTNAGTYTVTGTISADINYLSYIIPASTITFTINQAPSNLIISPNQTFTTTQASTSAFTQGSVNSLINISNQVSSGLVGQIIYYYSSTNTTNITNITTIGNLNNILNPLNPFNAIINPGTYYFVAYLPSSTNYTQYISSWIPFTLIGNTTTPSTLQYSFTSSSNYNFTYTNSLQMSTQTTLQPTSTSSPLASFLDMVSLCLESIPF